MDDRAKSKINEQLARLSMKGNKPHQVNYLVKKRRLQSEGGGWQIVHRLPANVEIDLEEEIWQFDESWGGSGWYRVSLCDNDGTKIEDYGDIVFSVGNVEEADCKKNERVGIEDLLVSEEEDELKAMSREMRRRIALMQNMRMFDTVSGNKNEEVAKQIAELKEEIANMHESKEKTEIATMLEEMSRKGSGSTDAMSMMMMMMTMQQQQQQQAQESAERRALEERRMQQEMQKFQMQQEQDRRKWENEHRRQDTAQKDEKSPWEMMMILQEQNRSAQAQMEREKREQMLEVEKIRLQQEDKRETLIQERDRERREEEANKPKIADLLSNPAAMTAIEKLFERPIPPPTDWEKVMQSPMVLRMIEQIFSTNNETPLDKALPSLLTTVTESIANMQTKVTERLIEGADRPRQEDEFTQKMRTIQGMSASIIPHVSDMFERIAMIVAARKGISPDQTRAQMATTKKQEPLDLDEHMKRLLLELENYSPEQIYEFLKNSNPEILEHYRQEKYKDVVKKLNNTKVTQFWQLLHGA